MWKRLALVLLLALSVLPAHAVRARRHRKPRQPQWWEHREFVPSHENLLAQNAAIDRMGLDRIKDDKALRALVSGDELVPITENRYVRVSPKLEAKRRYCRAWVDLFLQELGRDYYGRFGEPIQVNSAVRTVRTQVRLLRWNRNAAPAHGETASAHLAGVAVGPPAPRAHVRAGQVCPEMAPPAVRPRHGHRRGGAEAALLPRRRDGGVPLSAQGCDTLRHEVIK